ncbi:MAG: hypothetical protein FWG44_01180, partial [Oscillospiraceae bacterium]|nr:hypothetical protein [Oscillospiraceae bacterium]
MLKLIVAPPGAGKTTFITERIRKAAVNQGAKQNLPPFLIVPEQSHFETERMIYQTLGAQTACNTEVLSFTKLAAKIITESRKDKAYASDTVREIGMFGAVAAVKDRLVFYKTASEKADFASRMLGAASVFQREGISPQDLAESAAEIESTRLKSKIADLALIYESYMESLSENFSDRQDEIRTAANIALETDFFEGRKIYIDGFDGFTGSQLLLLEAIIRGSKEATVTLTADKPDSAHIHYITTVKLTEKLKETAVRCRINAEIVVLNPLNTCGRTPEETETFLFPDTFAESNFVAAKIRELITCHNYFLNDIAVLNAPSPETLMSAFSAYGISAFADLPESVIEKPMVRFIITVLEAVLGIKGALLTLIKSGFIRVSGETAFRNTVKVNALRKVTGKRTYDYARPEKKSYRIGREMIKRLTSAAYEWQMEEADWYMPFPKESRFEPAERIRAEIVSEISALCERIKNTTGDKITEELSDFLINKMELGRTVADIVYRGEKVSSALNDEYRNLWETVISIFEAMHSALKNKEISIADYTVILKSVFGKTKTAKPPQVLDAVTVGDLRRTRVSGIKVVFLMGANQGECPKSIFSGAEFSAQETEKLCLAGIFIEENKSERYYRERF